MDENKNNDMSVDELLEKLKASLQTDNNEVASSNDDDDEIKKAVAAALDSAEKTEPAEETSATEDETVADAGTEPVAETTEADHVAEAAEEPEVVQEEPEVPTAQINDDDIFAAWGIDKLDVPKAEEPKVAETPADTYEAPKVSSSKAYYILRAETKEEYSLRKQNEAQKQSVDYDHVDYSLIKQALGMEKVIKTENEPQDFEVDIPSEPKTIDTPHAEFTYQRQTEDIMTHYSKANRSSGIKLLLTAIFAVILFVVECLPALGVSLPSFLNTSTYPLVYAMTTLQLVWLCGAVSYREVANGFFDLLKFRFTSGTLLGISILFCTVCSVVCCAAGENTVVYHFSAALIALVIRVFDFLDVRREMLAFDIVSSVQSQKYVVLNASGESVEQIEGLEDYTGEDSLILRTEKCTFVENYFARTQKRSERDTVSNKYVVPVLFAVALVSLVISLAGGATVGHAFGTFNMTFAIGLPALVLLSSAFPLYKATKKLYRSESTIIGESAVDDYSGTTMICFDDADAFPSYGVGLESLRIYGNSDIETIIEQMGAIFSKLGGPLKNVFTLMTSDCPKPYKVKVEEVYETGIKAVVDGVVLHVGSAAFMQENGFNVIDTTEEIGGKHFSTMYLADKNGVRAKFFIRYTLDGGFESIVKKLARHGIASVILTGDSNINDELLARSLDISRYPVKVVRRSRRDGAAHSDRADSGVVSRGSVGDLVSAVTMCDRLAKVISTMRAVRIATAVICAILMLTMSALKMTDAIPSLYVFVYHLFWLIPSWLVTKINL